MKINKIQFINTIMKSIPDNKITELIFNDPTLPDNEKYVLDLTLWAQENKDKSQGGENIDIQV